MKKNFVSVLLPVYNAEKFLPETLGSLIVQSHTNFEVIAVNDGSTDGSLEILHKYAAFDSRIKVIDKKNEGIVKTLNTAAATASGEFLARIDADDIATPKRFERQVIELLEHPKCVLVASSFDVINEEGEFLYHDAVPTLQKDIMTAMLYRNPIAHGSIMMRKDAFDKAGGYSPDCGPTEDYELWSRLLDLGTIRVLPQFLFRWRVNSTGITSTQSDRMKQYMDKNLKLFWAKHNFTVVRRSKVIKDARHYMREDSRRGIARKETMLYDLCKVSLKLLRRRRYTEGLWQLLIVASTGRSGLRIVHRTLKESIDWYITRHFKHYVRSLKKRP